VRALLVRLCAEEPVRRVAAATAPPNTTFAMSRWMLIGIHVAFAMATPQSMAPGGVSGVT
jgi:hypothetical protein